MTSSVYVYVGSSLLGLLLLTLFLDNIRPTSAPPAGQTDNYSYWQASLELSLLTTSVQFVYNKFLFLLFRFNSVWLHNSFELDNRPEH